LEVKQLEDRWLLSTLTALTSFDNTNGANPTGSLIQDSNGNFFGTTLAGGATGQGTIFELAHGSNTISVLASFSDSTGTFPQSGLIADSSGNLFGTTSNGGPNNKGTVFELAHGSSTITVLSSFDGTNGANPVGGLIADNNGNLFGMAELGGANSAGTVFELPHGSNTIIALASFNNTNGADPVGSLTMDSNGNLFGVAGQGGAKSVGTVFELAHGSNVITVLASFDTTNGANPVGTPILDSSGNLFGLANTGGVSGFGTVYELAHGSSAVTALASFNSSTGDFPNGSLIADSSGNLFGVAEQGGASHAGTVFELAQGSGTITVLASFDSTNGSVPIGNLSLDSTGNLFGTAYTGGANGFGTVFELSQRPSISTQPQNISATVGQGASVSIAVAASEGTAPLSYQWQISTDSGASYTNLSDASGVAGATTATLTLSGFATAGSPKYRVIVTDSSNVSISSNPATVTINAAPAITTQPQNASVTVGQTASVSFAIAASSGTTPLGVQWQISTDNGASFTNLTNGNGVSGITTTTLTVSGFSTPGSPEYRALVTDANNVSATSNIATLTIHAAPTIVTQPQSSTVTASQSTPASFTIAVSGGTAPFGVQWQISTDNGVSFTNLSNGSGVAGATSTTLTISGFSGGSPEYRAVVVDANHVSTTSNAAALTINAAPSIISEPQNATATVGQAGSVSFSTAANGGTAPLTVQWQISTDNGANFTNLNNGNGVSGATSTTLTISGFSLAGSPEYRAVVADANHVSATSNVATLAINAAPSITTQPQNATATIGQTPSESFTIAASGGTTPLAVQWQISADHGASFTNLKNGNGVGGATTTTLTISGFTTTGAVEYQAIVTDADNVSATSTAATLTINAAPNPATPNQKWLSQVYADLFNRALDPSGLATWSNLLNQGVSRAQVVADIQHGLEYRTDVVQALYHKLLQRAADASGLDSFTSFLGNGGTAEQVEATIIGSAEYFQLHGGTNASFLSGVYQDVLNRALDAGGAQSWATQLAGGVNRGGVASAILGSLESDRDEVQSLYSEFLHRPADADGLNAFTTALQHGVTNEAATASIVGSDEYFARSQQSSS
jgi:uncharacterized repeat protein (TIGR03803 family)